MNQEVWQYRQRMNHLFAEAASIDNLELQAHFARYLCVLTSGFLEVSMRALFSQYARDSSAPYVANYVEQKLKDFQSPKMNNLCSLTRLFNPLWADQLEADTLGHLKDAVDSIVANRHLIAHGNDVGITYARIKDYYEKAVEVINLVRAWCDPDNR